MDSTSDWGWIVMSGIAVWLCVFVIWLRFIVTFFRFAGMDPK